MKIFLITLALITVHSLFATLTPIANFGTNPGFLKGYYYIPTNLSATSPLVIVCHGCDQDAQEIADRTDWNKLADIYGFKVLYPEQSIVNNLGKCFNWYNASDNERGQGELASINQMIDYMVSNHNINGNRIYITGMSAGAGMTVNFAAAYPDVINRAASLAGLPYKAAASALDASYAMNPGYDRTTTQWGDKVRNENTNYTGEYPKMAIFHGTTDAIVAYSNANELTEQWCNVNGTDINSDSNIPSFQNNNIVNQSVYLMSNGIDTAVVRYNFVNIGHVVPIDEGTGTMQGGTPGDYTQDINFYSTYWVADFFNLIPTIANGIKEETTEYAITVSTINKQALTVTINSSDNTTYGIYDFNGRLIKQGYLTTTTRIDLDTPLHLGIITIKKEGVLIYSKKVIFE